MAHLKSVLRLFARNYFGGDVHIRFRPSFFPFTEPSVEVDMHWNDRWIEMGGAGMVDPEVFKACRLDPDAVTLGRQLRDRALHLWATCRESGRWPTWPDLVNELHLPAYAYKETPTWE